MNMSPGSWLCSVIDMINSNNKSQPFKLVKQGHDSEGNPFYELLHRDSGAVWRFTTEVVRGPVT